MDEQDRWVAKVHPMDREAEAEDPFELMADMVVGDPEVMMECILQEYVWMGWSREELLSLFRDPGYPVLCDLASFYGQAEVERRVDELLARMGNLHFTAFVAEPDEEDDDDHHLDLLQITPNPSFNP